MERPPGGDGARRQTTCLFTRNPALGRASFEREWTIEAVVLFLNNPHFATQWQTVIGRNGYRLSESSPNISSLALKLSPGRRLLLQAWLAPTPANASHRPPPRLVSAWSAHAAQPNAWYHIAVVCAEGSLRLHVNSHLEAVEKFEGRLALPTRPTDGDLTFGCGMHAGVPADTCSCLLSELRASNRSLPADEWLWSAAATTGMLPNETRASGEGAPAASTRFTSKGAPA